MTNIEEQLRKGINTYDSLEDCVEYKFLCEQAAEYIAQLEKERNQYRMAAEEEAKFADEYKLAAERYFWLREQQWYNSNMCVVINPKAQLKLGTDCPSLDRLDTLIDEARGKK